MAEVVDSQDEDSKNGKKRKRKEDIKLQLSLEQSEENHVGMVADDLTDLSSPKNIKRMRMVTPGIVLNTAAIEHDDMHHSICAAVVDKLVSHVAALALPLDAKVTEPNAPLPPKTKLQATRKRKLGMLSSSLEGEGTVSTSVLKRPKQIALEFTGIAERSRSRSSSSSQAHLSPSPSPKINHHRIIGVRSPGYYRSLRKALEARIGAPGFHKTYAKSDTAEHL
jgi:hypothetical protein